MGSVYWRLQFKANAKGQNLRACGTSPVYKDRLSVTVLIRGRTSLNTTIPITYPPGCGIINTCPSV